MRLFSIKDDFNPTKQFGKLFLIDERNGDFKINSSKKTYNIRDIYDFELIEDGKSIVKGNAGKALVGGALFGVVGAIAGASSRHKQKEMCTKMQIRIGLRNNKEQNIYILLIFSKTKKDGIVYKSMETMANDILTYLSQKTK